VLALYGPWGSGKSTVLSYVGHYLDQLPEGERPAVVAFNPWWFSGQENLARAFLGQLQAVLPAKSEKFKKLGGLLGDFAEGIGGLIDLSGMTGGVGAKLGKLIGMATTRKPKDDSLKSSMMSISPGSRIVHYDTLIRGAQEAYSAYIEKSKSLDKLEKIVDRI
jgi:predicted KAP-like P-loop ATPase